MADGPHSATVPVYFRHMYDLFREVTELDQVKVDELESVKAKTLYSEFTSTLPPPKCVYKVDNMPWEVVWERLENPVMVPLAKELMFMISHNIIPNRQRLFRMNKVRDPRCLVDMEEEDNLHMFTGCRRVRVAWAWVRGRVGDMLLDGCQVTSDFEMLNFAFPSCPFDTEIVWLISTFCDYVYNEVLKRHQEADVEELKAILKTRYLENNHGNRPVIDRLCFSLF